MAEPTNGMRLWGKNPWVNWAKPKNSKEAKIRPANVGQALYNPSPSSTAETLQREMEPIEAVYSNLPVTPVLPGMKMSPLFPGMTLSHTGLPQLQRYQITSAVSLLELYCGLHNLPPPQYSLYSLPDERGNLWPVYETQSSRVIGPTSRLLINCSIPEMIWPRPASASLCLPATFI
ncbi:uncharacterized protein LOC144181117 isoform X2 [Stigmatopora nigra]